jgi:hypothetical protein
MSNITFGMRELLTRFQLGIPFGTKEQWEAFIQNYYVPCYMFVDVLNDIGKYQKKIIESIISGNGQVNIWEKLITLDPVHNNKNHNYLIKSIVDGNMGVYGFPEIEFNKLESCINTFINSEKEKDDSSFKSYGLTNYRYRVTSELIDESTHTYNIVVKLFQYPLENPVFDDLLQFGLGIYEHHHIDVPNTQTTGNISSLVNQSLDSDLLVEEMKIIQHQMNEDGIELNLEDI